jgi:hypothetical protein
MKLHTLLSCLALSSFASFASPVSAEPTQSIGGGNTIVTLAPELLTSLQSLNVRASRVEESSARNNAIAFPVIEGLVDLANAKAEILHSGGLRFSSDTTSVKLINFVVDTSGESPVITGDLVANNSFVARAPLFNAELPSLELPLQPTRRSLRIRPVQLTLTPDAATALNEAFGVTAFQADQAIGQASINLLLGRSDRISSGVRRGSRANR